MPLEIKVTKAPTELKETKVFGWGVGDCGYKANGDLYIKTFDGAWCISCREPYTFRDRDLGKTEAIMDPNLKVTITVG